MQKMLRLVYESVDVVFKGADPSDSEVISKNLYAEGSSYSEGEFPYFWLMLGHQETLFPLTNALGKDRSQKLPFSGAYFFEYFTFEGEDFVSTRLRDDMGEVYEIDIDCADQWTIQGQGLACTAVSFKQFIGERLALADSVSCDADYDPEGVVYSDIDVYSERLIAEIGLAPIEEVGLMIEAAEPAGFDWAAATIGASVGFVAAYALSKVTRAKTDDAFHRI